MCGIAGIVGFPSNESDLKASLEAMKRGIHHRGPDDEGLFISRDRRTGFVHTRLSILDLSPAGHQPMSTPDGRFTITYNGEIYNFRLLRSRLEKEGVVFESRSDTEVLLRLYERQGPEFVRELRGMFALAIWDELERTCFLARGPLGIKPLYYYDDGRTLYFASELRALLDSGSIPRKVSPAGLFGYLLYGSVPEPRTLVANVLSLPAAYSLLWREGKPRMQRYWDIHFSSQEMDHETSVRMVREALEDSVEHHFVSDVPVGIFLSGGLDSTALVALATRAGRQGLSTFCISTGDSAMDEAAAARRTARHFGTNHFELRIEASRGKSLLHEFLQRMDQPTIDGFNTFCVSKEAHEQGAKVVLSGLGADELFAGYSSFDRVPRMMRWSRWLALVKPLRLAGGHSLEHHSASPKFRRLGTFLGGKPSSKAAYRAVRGVFTAREALTIARQYLDGTPISAAESDMVDPELPPQPSLRDEVSYLEITRYMGNQLLRDSDVMSMAWGLELRVPYVDRRLVEIVSQIPARHRLAQGKKLLQDAVPELPDWVKGRRKRGFVFPFAQWISEEWSDVFAGIDGTSPVPLGSWYRRWSILALENCLDRLGLFQANVSRIR